MLSVRPRPPLLLSIIVPLAPDETEWLALLQQLADLPAGCEVILVRAGSHSLRAPPGWPDHLGFVECLSPQGRARQMNVGAQAARGRWLWFLHADSQLTPAVLPALLDFIRHDEEALAYFKLAFLGDGPWLTRLNAWGANLRARWLKLPFGDQGFVLPAATFRDLGGYDEQASYGEDHLLVWALRGEGVALVQLGTTLATSARKYGRHGWLVTTVRHGWLTLIQAWGAWRRMHREAR